MEMNVREFSTAVELPTIKKPQPKVPNAMEQPRFRFICPKCQKRMLFPLSAIGKKTKCPNCSTISVVQKCEETAPPAGLDDTSTLQIKAITGRSSTQVVAVLLFLSDLTGQDRFKKRGGAFVQVVPPRRFLEEADEAIGFDGELLKWIEEHQIEQRFEEFKNGDEFRQFVSNEYPGRELTYRHCQTATVGYNLVVVTATSQASSSPKQLPTGCLICLGVAFLLALFLIPWLMNSLMEHLDAPRAAEFARVEPILNSIVGPGPGLKHGTPFDYTKMQIAGKLLILEARDFGQSMRWSYHPDHTKVALGQRGCVEDILAGHDLTIVVYSRFGGNLGGDNWEIRLIYWPSRHMLEVKGLVGSDYLQKMRDQLCE